jgi:hypothetical protein
MTKSIIAHLCHEWCIVTTLKQKQADAAFHIQWDLTAHITKFAWELERTQKLCRDIGVPAADATKIQYYVESMYASVQFDDKEMQAWEVKPTAEKTWEATKTRFITIYKSKEKFNAEHLTCTGGYESTHSIVSTSIGNMSPTDQHSMMEYTNSLEAALETAQEHTDSLTTAQSQLLRKLDSQQQELLTQTVKFMTLLNTRTPTLAPASTATRQYQPAQNTRTKKLPIGSCHCNSCNKDSVHHKDDNCFTFEKYKDKRPQWYVAKM